VETHIKSAQDAPGIESPVWLDMTDDLKGVYHKKDYPCYSAGDAACICPRRQRRYHSCGQHHHHVILMEGLK
jgi:hypothetical protein